MNAFCSNVCIVDDSVSGLMGHCYDYGKFIFHIQLCGEDYRHEEYGRPGQSIEEVVATGLVNFAAYVQSYMVRKRRTKMALDACWRE